MTDHAAIYRSKEAAFRYVCAYVILKGDRVVARVAFKRARSGLRTTCWLHVLGVPMTRAFAPGGGYDKTSASVEYAAAKLDPYCGGAQAPEHKGASAIKNALAGESGRDWTRRLEDAGFNVVQAL